MACGVPLGVRPSDNAFVARCRLDSAWLQAGSDTLLCVALTVTFFPDILERGGWFATAHGEVQPSRQGDQGRQI